jgi:Spx/MgsR family transcriptional regulator
VPKAPVKLYEYAACGTCKKAKKWLDGHGVAYEIVPIVERPPSLADLAKLVRASGLAVGKWFNTSGQSYRALIADVGKAGVERMTDEQKLELLAADGKLIKRPVLVTGSTVMVGFREDAYESRFGK